MKTQYGYTIIGYTPYVIRISLVVTQCPYFHDRISSKVPHHISMPSLLWLLRTLTVSQTLLLFDDLQILKNTSQVFCRMSFGGWDFSDFFFSWLEWGHAFLGDDHREKRPFSSHRVKGICYQHDILPLMLTLGMGLEVVLVRSLHCPVSLFFPFHGALGKEVTVHGAPWRSQEICSISLKSESPHKLFKIPHRRFIYFLSPIYLFNHLFIPIWPVGT